jgi:hypothetical protein
VIFLIVTGTSQGSIRVTVNADNKCVLLSVSDDDDQTKIAIPPMEAIQIGNELVRLGHLIKEDL